MVNTFQYSFPPLHPFPLSPSLPHLLFQEWSRFLLQTLNLSKHFLQFSVSFYQILIQDIQTHETVSYLRVSRRDRGREGGREGRREVSTFWWSSTVSGDSTTALAGTLTTLSGRWNGRMYIRRRSKRKYILQEESEFQRGRVIIMMSFQHYYFALTLACFCPPQRPPWN